MHIIRFGRTAGELPAGVVKWLLPAALAMDRIAAERRNR